MSEFGDYFKGSMLDVYEFIRGPFYYWRHRSKFRNQPQFDISDMTGEERRRYFDLRDPNAEYADDDPRKYGYYNIGTSGYLGSREHPHRVPNDDEIKIRGIIADAAEPWEPFRLTTMGYARVHNPEELSSTYVPPRKSWFRPSRRRHKSIENMNTGHLIWFMVTVIPKIIVLGLLLPFLWLFAFIRDHTWGRD